MTFVHDYLMYITVPSFTTTDKVIILRHSNHRKW